MVVTAGSIVRQHETNERIKRERGHDGLTEQDIAAINWMHEFDHLHQTGQLKPAPFTMKRLGFTITERDEKGEYEILACPWPKPSERFLGDDPWFRVHLGIASD